MQPVARTPLGSTEVREKYPFTVTLDAGTYRVEWFSVEGRETAEADDVSVNGSTSKRSALRSRTPPCCI